MKSEEKTPINPPEVEEESGQKKSKRGTQTEIKPFVHANKKQRITQEKANSKEQNNRGTVQSNEGENVRNKRGNKVTKSNEGSHQEGLSLSGSSLMVAAPQTSTIHSRTPIYTHNTHIPKTLTLDLRATTPQSKESTSNKIAENRVKRTMEGEPKIWDASAGERSFESVNSEEESSNRWGASRKSPEPPNIKPPNISVSPNAQQAKSKRPQKSEGILIRESATGIGTHRPFVSRGGLGSGLTGSGLAGTGTGTGTTINTPKTRTHTHTHTKFERYVNENELRRPMETTTTTTRGMGRFNGNESSSMGGNMNYTGTGGFTDRRPDTALLMGKSRPFRRAYANLSSLTRTPVNINMTNSQSIISISHNLHKHKMQVSNLMSPTPTIAPNNPLNNSELNLSELKALLDKRPKEGVGFKPGKASLIRRKVIPNIHPEAELLYEMKEVVLHPYPLMQKAQAINRKFSKHCHTLEHLIGNLEPNNTQLEIFSLFEGVKIKVLQRSDWFTNTSFQQDFYQILSVLEGKFISMLETDKMKEIKESIRVQRENNEKQVSEGLELVLNNRTSNIDFQKFEALLKEETDAYEKSIKKIEQATKTLEGHRGKAMHIHSAELLTGLDNESFRHHYATHQGFFTVIKQKMKTPSFRTFYRKFIEIEKLINKGLNIQKEGDIYSEKRTNQELRRFSSKVIDIPLSPIDAYRLLWDIIYNFLTSNTYLKGHSSIFQYVKRQETDIYEKLFNVNYKSIELFLYDFIIGMITQQLLDEKMTNLCRLQKIINIQRIFRTHLQKQPKIHK